MPYPPEHRQHCCNSRRDLSARLSWVVLIGPEFAGRQALLIRVSQRIRKLALRNPDIAEVD